MTSEEDGWHTLRTVAAYMGGSQALLRAFVPGHAVQTARMATSIGNVPFHVLALVLSYVPLQSVGAVMRVCRTWYATLNDERYRGIFWARRVKEALAIHNIRVTLDPFLIPDLVPKARFAWLKYANCELIGTDRVRLYLGGTYVADYTYHKDGVLCNVVYGYHYSQTRDVVDSDYVEYKEYMCSQCLVDGRRFQRHKSTNVRQATVHFASGDVYVGDVHRMVPYGDGKWTLADGQVIEGKGVACMGEIRVPMERAAKRLKS